MAKQELFLCNVCNNTKKAGEVMPFDLIRSHILDTIKKEHPDFSPGGYVCLHDLNHYRNKYIQNLLEEEKGDLTNMENAVLASLKEQELLSKNINIEFYNRLTMGEKIADRVAEFGGSWHFILLFLGLIAVWIATNSFLLLKRPFDPYPFILLNLLLSCLAAFQAPVIMMSQNRQEAKDRMRSEHDYAVNLKAELEIRNLNTKIDQLISHQWHRLLEIQQVQVDMMQELMLTSRRGNA